MATKLPRFSLTIPVDLLDEIDQYQRENNLDSRSAAINQLVNCGIDSLIEKGLIGPINKPPTYTAEALNVARDYELLSRRDKGIVSAIINYMLES